MTALTSKDCVVLVPCGESTATACEQSLHVFELRGDTVRRVRVPARSAAGGSGNPAETQSACLQYDVQRNNRAVVSTDCA